MPAPAAAPGTHVTRDPVPNTRSPRNRRQSNSLTRTSLSATHVRAAARSALLRALPRTAPPAVPAGPRPGASSTDAGVRNRTLVLEEGNKNNNLPTGDETLTPGGGRNGSKQIAGVIVLALGSGNSVNSTRGGPWGEAFPAPPRMWAGPEGDAAGDCQHGWGWSAVAVGAGPTQTVPSAGWEAGPARRLTRGRSGKASAWRRVRGRACAVRGGEGAREAEGWPPAWVEGAGWRPGLAWKLVILVWLEI